MSATSTNIEMFQLRRAVQLWLALCRCPGSEWQPTLNNYKLQRHIRTCEFRIEIELEWQEFQKESHGKQKSTNITAQA